jgi:hypothetical protein
MKVFMVLLILVVTTSLIYPQYIRLISPNGYEKWRSGSTHSITWERQYGNQFDSIDLYYISETRHLVARLDGYETSYQWTIPYNPYNSVVVYILAYDDAWDYDDYSDNPFIIYTGSLTVTSPNGGESWKWQSFHDITWNCSGNIPAVNIDYSIDFGVNWLPVASGVKTDLKKYSWMIPKQNSSMCLVRIQDNIDQYFHDASNNAFTIYYGTGFDYSKAATSKGLPSLSASPNPFANTLTLTLPYPASIYSLSGQMIKSLPKGSHSIDTSFWRYGVYLILCGTEVKRITKIE